LTGATWEQISRSIVLLTGDRWWTGRNCRWGWAVWHEFQVATARSGKVEGVVCRGRDETLRNGKGSNCP
jgi:hypothetical protein